MQTIIFLFHFTFFSFQNEQQKLTYGPSQRQNEIINAHVLHEAGITGYGVTVGVIDSGFEVDHEAFAKTNIKATYDFIGDDTNVRDEGGELGQELHGTAVFSAIGGYQPDKIIGVAFGATFLLAKTELSVPDNPELKIEEDYFLKGIDWLHDQGAHVISSSLAFTKLDDQSYYTPAQMDGQSSPATLRADLAVDQGIVFVQAAGNEFNNPWRTIVSPSDGFKVISVGATDLEGVIAFFSSAGPTADGRPKPEVVAPGHQLIAADFKGINKYYLEDGTSMATPLVAGACGLILSAHPELTPQQLQEALYKTARKTGNEENRYGYGMIDAYAAASYWGPIFSNRPQVAVKQNKLEVSTHIISNYGLIQSSAKIIYKMEGRKRSMLLNPQESTKFFQSIEIPQSKEFSFYFECNDRKGNTTRFPNQANGEEFVFNVETKKLTSTNHRRLTNK